MIKSVSEIDERESKKGGEGERAYV